MSYLRPYQIVLGWSRHLNPSEQRYAMGGLILSYPHSDFGQDMGL